MKALRQHSKPTGVRPAAQKPVQRVSKRHTRHEQQADLAARRVLHGEFDAAHELTPAPPAPRLRITSRGESLPAHLRTTLEQGFNADLNTVQLHHDNAAHEAAFEQARAFAAGPHIYFSAGAYDPHSSAGRRLIAHEVAHVLQQTGHSGADGRLYAAEVYGSGEFQRDALFDDISLQFTGAAVEVLEQAQAGGNTDEVTQASDSRDRLESMILMFQNLLSPGAPLNATEGTRLEILDLEKQVLSGMFDAEPLLARSFLFDMLKQLGRYEGALYLLEKDWALLTTQRLQEFADYFSEARPEAWVLDVLNQHPALSALWPEAMLDELWVYLLDPLAQPRQIEAYLTALAEFNEASSTGLIANERVFLAYQELAVASTLLFDKLTEFQASAESSAILTSASGRRMAIARRVEAWGQEIQASGEAAFVQDWGQQIAQVGHDALAFWEDAAARIDAPIGTFEPPQSAFPKDDTLNALCENLLKAVSAQEDSGLFHVHQDQTPLSPDDYDFAVWTLNALIEETLITLAARVLELMPRSRAADDASRDLAVWYGWMQMTLEHLRAILTEYKLEADQQFVEQYGSADQRLAHRLQVARFLSWFGQVAGWTDLVEQAQPVLAGEDLGQSYIAMTGQWEFEADTPLEKMLEDFDPSRRIRGFPVTTGQYVSFFQLQFAEELNRVLGDLLEAEEGVVSPAAETAEAEAAREPMLKRAIDTARTLPRPYRYHMTEAEIVFLGDSETGFSELIRQHPRVTGDFQKNHVIEGERMITPVEPTQEIFIWVAPPLDELIAFLRANEGINNLLRTQSHEPDRLDDAAFMQALNAVMDGLGSDNAARNALALQLDQLITGQISAGQDAASLLSQDLLRRVTTYDRRVLAQELEKVLQAYIDAREGFFTNKQTHYTDLNRVLDEITRFSAFIQPADTYHLQMTALITQLAPLLYNAFVDEFWFVKIREERYDLITGYYGLIDLAAQQNAQGPETLLPVLHSDEDFAAFQLNAAVLPRLLEEMQAVIEPQQRDFGFQSLDGQTLMAQNFDYEIEPGQPFTVDGVDYQIISVRMPFRYHPPYGVGTGAETPAIVEDQAGSDLTISNPVLFTYSFGGGKAIEVRAQDDDALRHMWHIIDTQAFLLSLENLEQVIEHWQAGIELGLDVAEVFIPPVMVARTLAELSRFIIMDMPDIRTELMEHPEKMIQELIDSLHIDRLTVIEFLLFGDMDLPAFFPASARSKPASSKGRSRSNKLGKLIQFVKSIGYRVGMAFGKLRFRTRSATVRAQMRLAAHPRVFAAVQMLPAAVEMVYAGFQQVENSREMLRGLLDKPREFINAMNDMIEGLNGLELPDEVMPMGLVYEIILGYFMERFGKKGKLIKLVLEQSGALSQASQMIADALKEGGYDPNKIWQEQFKAEAQKFLDETRDTLLNAVFSVVSQATGGAIQRPEDIQQLTIDFYKSLPELEPLLMDESEIGKPAALPPVRASGGAPLPPALRGRVETLFGHDFSHVRLHTGPDAARLTEQAEAYALTSGSHVYMNPDLLPLSGASERVLLHELAHVLQQTGPRLLDEDHDSRPRLGTPGKGLRRDPQREAAANRMVYAARREHKAVAVEEEGGEGLLPAMTEVQVALGIIDKLTQPQFAQEFTDELRRDPAIDTAKPSYKKAETKGINLWNIVKRNLNAKTVTYFGSASKDTEAQQDIATYIQSVSAKSADGSPGLNAIIPYIVQRSLKSGKNNQYYLKPETFVNYLEVFVYGRTGINLKIDANATGSDITKVAVNSINLALVNSNANIWQRMRDNTNAFIRGKSGTFPHTVYNPDGTTQILHIKWEEITDLGRWARIRLLLLNNQQSSYMIWAAREFRLSEEFIKEMLINFMTAKDVKLSAWADYANPNLLRVPEAGLRVGTHGEMTGATKFKTIVEMIREIRGDPSASDPNASALDTAQSRASGGGMMPDARKDRESHHIPQYLLVEYFRNDASIKMFEKPDERLPGFSPPGADMVDCFCVKGSPKINLLALDPTKSDRGRGLPAILLAARTHQKGQLHINMSGSWNLKEELEGGTGQAQILEDQFMGFLKSDFPTASGTKGKSEKAQIAEQARSDPAGEDKIYDAMKRTYDWMYDFMMRQLPKALTGWEIGYYDELVALQYPDPTTVPKANIANPALLKDAQDTIANMNSAIMSQWK